MIEYVNRNLVPVWVNVRADKYPNVPALADRDWIMMPTADGQVCNPYYLAYLARAYVLSPDGRTLLNEEDGMFAHGGVDGEPFVDMLRRAMEWHKVAHL